jgi:hypothetical protein
MSAAFRISSALWEKIHHFASFPQTGGQSIRSVLLCFSPLCPCVPLSAAGLATSAPIMRPGSSVDIGLVAEVTRGLGAFANREVVTRRAVSIISSACLLYSIALVFM